MARGKENRTATMKAIHNLFIASGMTSSEFHNKFCKELDASNLKYPVESTTNRWINGIAEPPKRWMPYIAKTLGKTLEEIEAETNSEYERMISELSAQLHASEEERLKVERVLWLDGKGVIILAVILVEFVLLLVNLSFFKSALFFIMNVVSVVLTVSYFNKCFPDEREHKGIRKKIKNNIEDTKILVRLATKKSIISGIISYYLVGLLFVTFLPLIESIFYRGSFKVSIVVDSIVALMLLVKGIRNR